MEIQTTNQENLVTTATKKCSLCKQELFQRPFKDGDIVAVTMIPEGVWTGIFKQYSYNKTAFESHCSFSTRGEFCGKGLKNHGLAGLRLATEEEKQKLFDTIKAKGYKWNAETKTLEKLIIPKFKVGDKIRHKTTNKDYIYEISKVYDDSYGLVDIYWTIYMTYQDHYELVPNKFDITTLKPFDKVLVAHQKGEWHIQFFEKYSPTSKFPFICIGGSAYQRCVPYGDNKHLMNTTNDCDEYYKTWE